MSTSDEQVQVALPRSVLAINSDFMRKNPTKIKGSAQASDEHPLDPPVCVCVRACVRACVRVCVRACMCVVCVCNIYIYIYI